MRQDQLAGRKERLQMTATRISIRRMSALLAFLLIFVFTTACGSSASASQAANISEAVSSDSTRSGSQYTFVWMSDTQYYSASYPEIFCAMTKWVADNKNSRNIKAVFHTGDLVDDESDSTQWNNAVTAMSLLNGAVPYTVLAGNNDVSTNDSGDDYTEYLKYFGQAGGSSGSIMRYKDGEAMALLLEAGTEKYVVLAIGWDADSKELSWADEILAQYADRVAIVTTHDYMKSDGSLSSNGENIFREIVRPNANVRLVLCGHKYSAARRTTEIDDNGDGTADRTVWQLLADYQNSTKGGDGYLRLLTVDEDEKTLSVKTYSPYLDQYNCFSASEDEFVLSIADWWQ